MTIRKRIWLCLSLWFIISFFLGAVLLYLGIKNSPGLYHMVQVSKHTFVEPITAMGFEYTENYGAELFRKEDPYGNERSTVSISYDSRGQIESFRCKLAYVNTISPEGVYNDMKTLAGLAGFSLNQEKEEILEIIEKIKKDQSSRTSGELEEGGWSIGTNVYKTGKIRRKAADIFYAPFGKSGRVRSKKMNWMFMKKTCLPSTFIRNADINTLKG